MIYIVGLNHKYQLEGYEDNWVHFYKFVSKKPKTLDADLLVEEMSEDGLKSRVRTLGETRRIQPVENGPNGVIRAGRLKSSKVSDSQRRRAMPSMKVMPGARSGSPDDGSPLLKTPPILRVATAARSSEGRSSDGA